MKTLQKKYDSKYDVIKFVLSLAIVAIHTALYPMALYPWLRIAVPLFFMMSSYFLFYSMKCVSPEKHISLLRNFVFRNIKLYLCWFVILFPITLYVRRNVYFSGDIILAVQNFIKGLFWGSTFVASWFIVATIWGVLIIYWLCKILKKDWAVFLISFFAFCLVTLESSYSSCIEGTVLMAILNELNRIFGGIICSYPASLIWIFIGKCIAEDKVRGFSHLLQFAFLAISCAGLYCEWKYVIHLEGAYNNDSYFMLLPVCFLIFCIIQKIPPIEWKRSIYFKHVSTIIYVSHGSILTVIGFLATKMFGGISSAALFLLTSSCCIILACIIELANKKCTKKRVSRILRALY